MEICSRDVVTGHNFHHLAFNFRHKFFSLSIIPPSPFFHITPAAVVLKILRIFIAHFHVFFGCLCFYKFSFHSLYQLCAQIVDRERKRSLSQLPVNDNAPQPRSALVGESPLSFGHFVVGKILNCLHRAAVVMLLGLSVKFAILE